MIYGFSFFVREIYWVIVSNCFFINVFLVYFLFVNVCIYLESFVFLVFFIVIINFSFRKGSEGIYVFVSSFRGK